MSVIKNIFAGLLLLLLVMPSLSAETTFLQVTQDEDNPRHLEASLVIFNEEFSTGNSETVRRITECCNGEGFHDYCDPTGYDDWQTCVQDTSRDMLGAAEIETAFETVPYANISFSYWNPSEADWVGVAGCTRVTAEESTEREVSHSGGAGTPIEYWYAECTIPGTLLSQGDGGTGRLNVKVDAVPSANNGLRTQGEQITIITTQTSSEVVNKISIMLDGILADDMTAIPCLGVFGILGLLLASMYFSGKSPISLLDITTPRLPGPKGVTASGQIIAPYGYSEMKKTIRDSMGKARGALGTSLGVLAARIPASDRSRISRKAKNAPLSAADKAGNSKAEREMAENAGLLAQAAGKSSEEVGRLASTIPSRYGAEENQLMADVINTLEQRGGREALAATTMKQWLAGQDTMNRLDALTGHPEIAQKSAMHKRVQNALGKTFGRYTIMGGAVTGTVDSMARSFHTAKRGVKAAGTHGKALAREMTKTATVSLVGGEKAFDARRRAAKGAGGLRGAYYESITTPAHQQEAGGMFPILNRMSDYHKRLSQELTRDEMRHVIDQIYRKKGVRIELTDEELVSLGHKDLDILKRAGVKGATGLAALEEEIRGVLSDSGLGNNQKLSRLMDIAEAHGVDRSQFSDMMRFHRRLEAINESAEPDHVKMLSLQALVEEHHKEFAAGNTHPEGAFHSFIGRDNLTSGELWNMTVLRGMIHDAEEGQLHGGGIKEALEAAWLRQVNRLTTLDPTSNTAELPEMMAKSNELGSVRDRALTYMKDLMTEEGAELFRQTQGKSVQDAGIGDLIKFLHGGAIEGVGHMPRGEIAEGGIKYFHEGAMEFPAPKGAFKADMDGHWLGSIETKDSLAMGPWIHRRFTGGYQIAHDPEIEARMDRMPGSSSWSLEKRRAKAQQLWLEEFVHTDMKNNANSTFCHSAYGDRMGEVAGSYNGIVAAFLGKAFRDKGMPNNHDDRRFLEQFNGHEVQDIKQLRHLSKEYQDELHNVVNQKLTYDDLTGAKNTPWVGLRGGYVPYTPGLAVGDKDKIFGGEVALFNKKTGSYHAFEPNNVDVNFGGREDLERMWMKLLNSGAKTPNEWQRFMREVTAWGKEGGYNYDKAKIVGAVAWRYANVTYDYKSFWGQNDVKIMPKRETVPLAPNIMRMFGAEAPGAMKVFKPFRDMAMHLGDYVSRVALDAGGAVHRASWEVTPYSEYYRQQGWRNYMKIMSTDFDQYGLSEQEKKAYRSLALSHGRYDNVWAVAIDRNPFESSSSFGAHQTWAAKFNFGPSSPMSARDNLRSYMSRGEYINFMIHSGFVVETARRMMAPFVNMTRGPQMSMQGYASRWDYNKDTLRSGYNYTQPRMLEALQSINPFTASLGGGKLSRALGKANYFQGSLEARQLAGKDFRDTGLSAGPQDSWMNTPETYTNVRVGSANPGLNFLNYRMKLKMDPNLAGYMWSMGNSASSYMHDVKQTAMYNINRRTSSSESLALRRAEELRGFGMSSNSMFGFLNVPMFAWHMPGLPWFGGRAITNALFNRVKYGKRQTWGQRISDTVSGAASAAGRAARPWKMANVVYCPNCGRAGYRGGSCSSRSCRQMLY
jgi:hypothetical protein